MALLPNEGAICSGILRSVEIQVVGRAGGTCYEHVVAAINRHPSGRIGLICGASVASFPEERTTLSGKLGGVVINSTDPRRIPRDNHVVVAIQSYVTQRKARNGMRFLPMQSSIGRCVFSAVEILRNPPDNTPGDEDISFGVQYECLACTARPVCFPE